jgi:hypothetical protein
MQPVILNQESKGPGTDAEAGSAGTTRRPGRPRSEQAEQAIIEATLDLFAEQGSARRRSTAAGRTRRSCSWPRSAR